MYSFYNPLPIHVFFFRTPRVRILTLGVFIFSLLCLSGCKNIFLTGNPKFNVSRYRPPDDGIPLTKDERKALKSKGAFDRRIASHIAHDTKLHFKKLVRCKVHVTKCVKRGNRYFAYIEEVFRQENLPVELAYIAFIESGYNPLACSQSGARGIWQFMPSTGKYFGMAQNHWVDQRCNIHDSTKAAAAYFKKLYKLFNDWHLVILAYNAGEGKISRALTATNSRTCSELIKRNHRLSDKMRLSGETIQYLPRFLAVCKLMRNLDRLGYEHISKEYLRIVEIKVGPGTKLKTLASKCGMDWESFYAYNSGYMKHVTPPGVKSSIYIPHHKAKKLKMGIYSEIEDTREEKNTERRKGGE